MTELNMDRICELLAAKGIPAYVEQTGGGCATIYAGEKTPQTFTISYGAKETYTEDRYEACAGPGWFAGPGWTNGRADTSDFYVGLDDDGQGELIIPAHNRWDEEHAATAISDLIALMRAAKVGSQAKA